MRFSSKKTFTVKSGMLSILKTSKCHWKFSRQTRKKNTKCFVIASLLAYSQRTLSVIVLKCDWFMYVHGTHRLRNTHWTFFKWFNWPLRLLPPKMIVWHYYFWIQSGDRCWFHFIIVIPIWFFFAFNCWKHNLYQVQLHRHNLIRHFENHIARCFRLSRFWFCIWFWIGRQFFPKHLIWSCFFSGSMVDIHFFVLLSDFSFCSGFD